MKVSGWKYHPVYSEQLFKEALEEVDERIIINGVNNVRYTDDTAIPADNLEDLQHIMTRIDSVSQ